MLVGFAFKAVASKRRDCGRREPRAQAANEGGCSARIKTAIRLFPNGESRVISLINVESAIQAGEHKLPVKPGTITRVPSVRKVDDFNMAQTNFYYQQDGSWVAFAERQLQFLDASRRIFIIHATPGALQPTVTTIVDTNLRVEPR